MIDMSTWPLWAQIATYYGLPTFLLLVFGYFGSRFHAKSMANQNRVHLSTIDRFERQRNEQFKGLQTENDRLTRLIDRQAKEIGRLYEARVSAAHVYASDLRTVAQPASKAASRLAEALANVEETK